jgi:hypothetical protein
MRNPRNIFLACLLAISIPCAAQQASQPTLKLQVVAGRPVVDGVFINGYGPYRFLLDTGGQTNQIEVRLAQKLGLTAGLHLVLDTPGGSAQVEGGKVSKVTLGPVEADGQEFVFTRGDRLRELSFDVQGILGQEFLRHFDYTLDFARHQMRFGASPAQGSRVAFRLVHGCMSMQTNLGALMLDSGTDTLFLFRKSWNGVNALVRADAGRAIAVSLERAPSLRIGERSYYPAAAEFQSVANAPVDGLLPASVFRAVFVSNSERYVVFNPETPALTPR